MKKYCKTICLSGINAKTLVVSTEVTFGIGIHVEGLTDATVKESLLRSVTALQAKGYYIPGKRIVINVSPNEIRKEGTGFDLPMALTIIAATEQDNGMMAKLEKVLVLGELGLDGAVRGQGVPGCVQAVEAALRDDSVEAVIIPKDNDFEVKNLFEGNLLVFPVSDINEAIEAVASLSSQNDVEVPAIDLSVNASNESDGSILSELNARNYRLAKEDWKLLNAQGFLQRAVEIAAAGGHNMLLIGAPGSGKDTAARLVHALLPPLNKGDKITVAKIWSAAGSGETWSLQSGTHLNGRRPWRKPHVSASLSAMLGGGSGAFLKPGEVSLAHKGLLFLNDINECNASLSKALEAVIKDKKVKLSRLNTVEEIPADFQMVATSLPCPCGYHGEGTRCTCGNYMRSTFLQKLVRNPLYRQLTVQVLTKQTTEPNAANTCYDDFDNVLARISKAREMQLERYEGTPYETNSDVPSEKVTELLPDELVPVFEYYIQAMGLSVASVEPAIKMARTIADLNGREEVTKEDLVEAMTYRFADRRSFIPSDIDDENEWSEQDDR